MARIRSEPKRNILGAPAGVRNREPGRQHQLPLATRLLFNRSRGAGPGPTIFAVVQGAHNLVALTNLLAAFIGTLPNMVGQATSARVLMTGVAAASRRRYGGAILIAVGFLTQADRTHHRDSRPALLAYMVVTLSLLFVQGMRIVFQDGIDTRKATVVGVSLWIGVGFQNQAIFSDILSGTWGALLGNGMTTGSVAVVLLSMLMELTRSAAQSLHVEMDQAALPKIDAFLSEFASKAGWNEASAARLRSAGEETLLSLLPQDDDHAANRKQRLTVSARHANGKIQMSSSRLRKRRTSKTGWRT